MAIDDAPQRVSRRGVTVRSAARELVPAVVIGALGTLAVLLQLFWRADVGLADNGDGFRLMCEFELLKSVDTLFNQLVVQYTPSTGCASGLGYFSSQQWLVAPAVWVYQLRFGTQAGFDLRTLGVLHALVYGAALSALFLGLPGSRLRRALMVLGAGALLADISFVSYFVSPFSEPATFLGLLLVVAAAAWYVRTTSWAPVALTLLTAAGVFLALAKSQTFVFALLLVPVLLLRRVSIGRWSGRWSGRIAPAVAALVLVGSSGANLLQQPAFFTQVNLHNVVFFTLLKDAADPGVTLRELGASPALVRYQGTGFFAPGAGMDDDPEYRDFQRRVSRGDVMAYIATHPRHWVPMLREGAYAAAVVRVHYLSNYRTPRPQEEFRAPRPDPTRRLLGVLGPAGWPLLPLAWLVIALGATVVALRPSTSTGGRSLAVVCYLLGAGALTQVVVALLGDGYYELVKHTILAAYATAMLFALGVGGFAAAGLRRLRTWRDGRDDRRDGAGGKVAELTGC